MIKIRTALSYTLEAQKAEEDLLRPCQTQRPDKSKSSSDITKKYICYIIYSKWCLASVVTSCLFAGTVPYSISKLRASTDYKSDYNNADT